MANRFEVATIFRAVDRMTVPLRRIQNRMSVMARSATRSMRNVHRATQNAVKGVKRLGQSAVIAGALITAPLAAAAKAGIDFEHTLVSAAAKYPVAIRKGTEAFAELERAAMKTGATSSFTATQSAEALNFLAMAGFNARNSIAALPGVVDLATVAATTLGEATDIATDSLGALGLMTKDPIKLSTNLARVNDVLARTTTSANVTLVDMFESIKDGAPVGVAAGQSVETLATFIAKMGDAGIKGTRGGTALKNIFTAFAAPASEAGQVMRRLGIVTVDAMGDVRDGVEIFKDFNRAVKDLPSAQKLGVFEKVFGKIPLAAAINITAAAEGMSAYRDTLLDAGGTATQMAAIMRDDTRGSLDTFKSAIEGVGIELFAMNRGPMKEAIDNATLWVRANGPVIAQELGQFFLDVANNIDKVVASFKAVGLALAGLWALNTVLGVIVGTMTAINLMMAANPFVLGALAIAAAATAIYVAWEPLKTFFTELFESIDRQFDGLRSTMTGVREFFDGFDLGFGSGGIEAHTGYSAYGTAPPPAVSSPQERQASILEEKRTTNTTEVLIKDETGRAVASPNAAASGVTVQRTGGF